MDQLRKNIKTKVQASSLVETLIATIIIMIVFGIAMLSISNVLENSVKNATNDIETELTKLTYLYQNGLVDVPDQYEYRSWNIQIKKVQEGDRKYVIFKGTHKQNNKSITKKLFENEKVESLYTE